MIKIIRPLCVLLPKMNAYRRDFAETKYMSCLIKDDELSKKYEIKKMKFGKKLEIV